MKYGSQYITYKLSDSALEIVNNAIDKNKDLIEEGVIGDSVDSNRRKTSIKWIKDDKLFQMLNEVGNTINKRDTKWNLRITNIEPVQYGIYNVNDHYDWHNDQGNVRKPIIRKISMSLFLNDPDEYEGGELDIDYKNPSNNPRYESLKLDTGYAVFFESHMWHRVRPITSGVRKSLVAWFCGPPYV